MVIFDSLSYSPRIPQMPPDLAPRFITSEEVEKLQTVDWAYLNQQKDAITDRWQKEIR